ncbi:hypothetical protein TVAG_281170 [Trichomonas vaginalis G3]|uniref:Calponin-homology (CH) domain-containing protein n=1 Tax=Trichomonas vaginalis (strain ATCC PRA-98 / G3) TaxID=412133 RepID=A2DRN7_TRIV3|nr:cilia- and flagella-associated protein 47 family [Trichomonas vaginalis G3]EAY17000.1 hypothetical protein TVAG_281170 [Trichomonas vaginalis G3]KAI5508947.1 cilia- and flagella-associated protein 47 family [Trichomonas vaginalis G3]|eukprot:XP_001329223.1 hypothetical protein [Trichomonas vaginalis G3]
MKISPEIIEFRDLEDGESDSIDVSITNISRKTLKIHFSLTNDCFSIEQSPYISITPGLTIQKEVTYTAYSQKKEEGTFSIISNDEKIDIPIIAYPQMPSFDINIRNLDLGNLSLSSNQTSSFIITNFGSISGFFKIATENKYAEIKPSSGNLDPNQNQVIQVGFRPPTTGPHEFEIKFELPNSYNTIPPLKVKAFIVGQSLEIFDNGIQTSKIKFGHAFYGQKISKSVHVKNNGPVQRTFQILPAHHLTDDKSESYFTPEEKEYTLEPNEDKEITFYFNPPNNPIKNDEIEIEIEQISTIEINNTNISFEIIFTGSTSQFLCSISPVDFSFGKQLIRSQTTKTLDIRNSSKHPISFCIKEIAGIHFSPSQGIIKQNSLRQIDVIFKPNSLGLFDSPVLVSFCDGFIKKKLNISGESVTSLNDETKFSRKKIWETNQEAMMNLKYPNNPYCMTQSDMEIKEKLNATFRDYISTTKNSQNLTLKSDKNNKENDINLGFNYGEGLIPPEPTMKNIKTKTENKTENIKIQPKNTQKSKIKQKPTTKLEIQECSKQLTQKQLSSVISSAESIDFGVVPIYGQMTKQFTIQNNLNQHIFVTFSKFSNEFSKSTPQSQVVFPQQTASFDLTVEGMNICEINQFLKYTINGSHDYIISCRAKIIPLEIKLSTKEIMFKYHEEQEEQTITKQITVTNPTSARANLSWTGFNDNFSIKPMNCSVQSNKEQIFDVTYKPNHENHSEVRVILNVQGGQQQYVRLIGETGNTAIEIEKNSLDFKIIPVGISRIQYFMVKSVGEFPSFFSVYSNYADFIQINPTNGILYPGEFLNLEVEVLCQKELNFDIPVTIKTCGYQPLTFNVTGVAQYPTLVIDCHENNLNFGEVFVGSSESRKITATNKSNVPATVFIKFEEKTCFKLEYSSIYDVSSLSRISRGSKVFKSDNSLQIARSTIQQIDNDYQIDVLPNSSVEFEIVFKPSQSGDFSFKKLPFYSDNIKINFTRPLNLFAVGRIPPIEVSDQWLDFGIVNIADQLNPNARPTVRQLILENKSHKPVKFKFDTSKLNSSISVEPSEGQINYSSTSTVFVIFKPTSGNFIDCFLPLTAITETEKFEIAKIQLTGIIEQKQIKLSQENLCFPIVPINIPISRTIYVENIMFVNATINVIVPLNEKSFPLTFELPEGNEINHQITKLPITFTFNSPKPISFSSQIAVVDNLGDSCTFTISATADSSVMTLDSFLMNNDCNILVAHNKPVIISLKSKNVMNDYISYISELIDIGDYEYNHKILDEQLYDFLTKFLNSYVMETKIEDIATDFSNSDGDKLVEVLNSLTGNKKPPNLSSIEKMKSESEEIKLQKMKSLLQLLISMGCLVSRINPLFLMSKTTYLSIMKQKITKMLLADSSEFDKEKWRETPMTKFVNSEHFQSKIIPRITKAKNAFNYISKVCWSEVILQVLKVFYLGKSDGENITQINGVVEAMRTTGIQNIDKLNKTSTLQSNYMTTIESNLMKWVSIHICKMLGPENLPVLFSDLRDPKYFANLIFSHIPNAKLNLIIQPSNERDLLENAKEVAKYISDLGIGINIKGEDIIKGSPIILCLLLFQLKESLPHYIPNTTIEFNCYLNESCKESLQIHNPGNVEILYKARINGSKNFTTTNEIICVKPNSSTEITVNYNAKTHHEEKAVLELVPTRNKVSEPKTDKATSSRRYMRSNKSFSSSKSLNSTDENKQFSLASTIVMNLKSIPKIKIPNDIFNVEGKIYELSKQSLVIPNLCEVEGTYKFYSYMMRIEDEFGNSFTNRKEDERIIEEFFSNPTKTREIDPNLPVLEQQIASHPYFMFKTDEVIFSKENGTINFEFYPVCLGKYRCYLLFSSKDNCEFLVEIQGKVSLNDQIDNFINLKTESGVLTKFKVPIESQNNKLINALSYGIARKQSKNQKISDIKLSELTNSISKEVLSNYMNLFFDSTFHIIRSLDNVECPKEYKYSALSPYIECNFSCEKAGQYSSKFVFINKESYDVRVCKVDFNVINHTHSMFINIDTTCGRQVKQDIPIENRSQNTWHFKASFSPKTDLFSCDHKFEVKPNSTYNFPFKFISQKTGEYTSQLKIINITKEKTVIFNIKCNVIEPLSEDKINIKTRAREKTQHSISIPRFIDEGILAVESDLSILSFNNSVEIKKNQEIQPFVIDIYSPIIGEYRGTLTFRDKKSDLYFWYIIEVFVDNPVPTQEYVVSIKEREKVSIFIPLTNSSDHNVSFHVNRSDDFIFGEDDFSVDAKSTKSYELTVFSFVSFHKVCCVTFTNDDVGTFIFNIVITVDKPDEIILSPLVSFLGRSSKTYVQLYNNSDSQCTFKVKNTIPESFHVICDDNISVESHQSKTVEIEYIPTCIGQQEECLISFESEEVGDYIYRVRGIGKPPQPESPYLVESPINIMSSGCIYFMNPFPGETTFEFNIFSDTAGVFNLLNRKHRFVLHEYHEQYQISFSFICSKFGQYTGSIIVSAVDRNISFHFPLIGISTTSIVSSKYSIHTQSKVSVTKRFRFFLAGENEDNELSEYNIETIFNREYSWLYKYFEVHVFDKIKEAEGYYIDVDIRFSPRKPLETDVKLIVSNSLGQKWDFSIFCKSIEGIIEGHIYLESKINSSSFKEVSISEKFQEDTTFSAYFKEGSSRDLEVTRDRGIIAESIFLSESFVPTEVVFHPKIYGKKTKGILVIDTDETQSLVEVTGNIPEYIPPKVTRSSYSFSKTKESETNRSLRRKHKNVIRENIDSVKITKPLSARRRNFID